MPYLQHPVPAVALVLALSMAATTATPAEAEVRRCTTASGGTLYTDRSCEALGAVERRSRPADPGTATAATGRRGGGCARRLDDLVYEVGSAIDARDTNRLAGSYHWTGMSTRSGYAVVDRLEAIAQRPLVDIVPVRPALVEAPAPAATYAMAGTFPSRTMPPAPPPRASAPEALRVQQTLTDGITPSTTVFGLRRHMDCWWITL